MEFREVCRMRTPFDEYIEVFQAWDHQFEDGATWKASIHRFKNVPLGTLRKTKKEVDPRIR